LSRHIEDAAFESFAEEEGGRVHVGMEAGVVKVSVTH
jgi:hypothetical protein